MRRALLLISAIASLIAVMLCALFCLAHEKTHEVSFVYQIGDGTHAFDSCEEWTRNVVCDKIQGYFAIWKRDSFDKDTAKNCIASKGFAKEEESFVLDALSRKDLHADTPTCSCSVRCSLRLCATGKIANRLPDIADACMEGFAKTLSENNALALDRAAYQEFQEKFFRERRIKELENKASCDTDKHLDAEISSERERIDELDKKIAEIGMAVDKRRGERLVLMAK
jgi:hypothetical protein